MIILDIAAVLLLAVGIAIYRDVHFMVQHSKVLWKIQALHRFKD